MTVAEKQTVFLFRDYIVPVVSTILIVFGAAVPALTLACFAMNSCFVLFKRPRDAFRLLFVLLPFAQIYKVGAMGGTSLFTILELLVIFICILKTGKIESKFLILWMVWAVYSYVGCQLDMLLWVKQIAIPLVIYLFFKTEHLDFREVLTSLILGLIISSVFGVCKEWIPNLSDMIRATQVIQNGERIYRFSGLYPDPNYYALVLSLCILSLLICFSRKEIGWKSLVIVGLFIYWGAQTGSKSFLLMLAAILVMFVALLFLAKRYLAGAFFTCIVTVLLILIIKGKLELFSLILFRLNDKTGDLLTARGDLWATYLSYLNENVLHWILGSGIAAGFINKYAVHNTYIEVIYYYGLIGSAVLVSVCLRAVGGQKWNKKFVNFLPLICMLVMMAFLSCITFFDFAFNFIFVFLAMKTNVDALNEEREDINDNPNGMVS